MRLQFKIQPYQTEAVDAVAGVFAGQSRGGRVEYPLGRENYRPRQLPLEQREDREELDTLCRNGDVELTDEQLLRNLRRVQASNHIRLSSELAGELGRCGLDVEMATGTGKTYVYIKTMFELNRRYGWSKFIVIVPSIAIREGVKQTFEVTQDHFMELYGRKARFFVYSGRELSRLDEFAAGSGVSAMIINTQAFAASLREGARNKDSRIIYSRRDEFASRRPIDVIRAVRPILILDEPQKMGGEITRRALRGFQPLFALYYSATHARQHNLVYALDALDAYRKKLVKRIEVKGFTVKNLGGPGRYVFLERIVLSDSRQPMARLEFEALQKGGAVRRVRTLKVGDSLYDLSNRMDQYRGCTLSEVDPIRGVVGFSNGETIAVGEAAGDISEGDMRRIQIRETILSHFEKEAYLFSMGIKTLSLFFIDEVAKYRVYDEKGRAALGEYGRIFQQEYMDVLSRYLTGEDTPYQRYLRERCRDPEKVHRGYFSIDRKTGRSVDSALRRGMDCSDDVSAYELILTHKERLLRFDEPTRFIFSHSALREGWDNPNVFQICALKRSDSQTTKRQEVGRGLRLCVNQEGERMDLEACGAAIHDVNRLTVIASESYEGFVAGLQRDIQQALCDRPAQADEARFVGQEVLAGGEGLVLDERQARLIHRYLVKNGYVDDETDRMTDAYRSDLAGGTLAPLPDQLSDMAAEIHKLIQSVFDRSALAEMVENGLGTRVRSNPLNENFYSEEFQRLWALLSRKFAYRVSFDSGELIGRASSYLNEKLQAPPLQYAVTLGRQADMTAGGVERAFRRERTQTRALRAAQAGAIPCDLVGRVAEGTALTRRTAAAILRGLTPEKLALFADNPEEFISKAVRLIGRKKAELIVENIAYYPVEGACGTEIFTAEQPARRFERAYRARKHIQDYVFTDGAAAEGVERRFARELDGAEEVCAYAKLPRAYGIPTPLGPYCPDWAIVFYRGSGRHENFVVDTKGPVEDEDLRFIARAKAACAKKLFRQLFSGRVCCCETTCYEALAGIREELSQGGGT